MPAASAKSPHVPLHAPTLFEAPLHHRFLIVQMTRSQVVGRYRGSYLGIFWSFINPLLLLCVYTLVFRYIFKAKFIKHAPEGPADFALMLFAALIVFNLFAECLTRAPGLILQNSNYVTKVVFPLEILPLTVVLGSLIHLAIGAAPLYLATFLTRHGHLHSSAFLWPLLLVPITLWGLAVAWMVSALGAFLRDLSEIVLALTQVLMYASAVFYSIDQVPLELQPIVRLNPLSFLCEQSRNLIVWGDPMDWTAYGWVTLLGLVAAALSYKVFMSVKPAFADVI